MLRVGLPKGTVKSRSERLIQAVTGEEINPRKLAYRARDGTTFFLLKHRDIPMLMKAGDLHLGITSTEWLTEKASDLEVLHRTEWCNTRISLVGDENSRVRLDSGAPFSCVTEFPTIASCYLAKRDLLSRVRFVATSGSTEALVPQVYDVGVDCIETGETLAANGLVELDVICEVNVVVVGLPGHPDTRGFVDYLVREQLV